MVWESVERIVLGVGRPDPAPGVTTLVSIGVTSSMCTIDDLRELSMHRHRDSLRIG